MGGAAARAPLDEIIPPKEALNKEFQRVGFGRSFGIGLVSVRKADESVEIRCVAVRNPLDGKASAAFDRLFITG